MKAAAPSPFLIPKNPPKGFIPLSLQHEGDQRRSLLEAEKLERKAKAAAAAGLRGDFRGGSKAAGQEVARLKREAGTLREGAIPLGIAAKIAKKRETEAQRLKVLGETVGRSRARRDAQDAKDAVTAKAHRGRNVLEAQNILDNLPPWIKGEQRTKVKLELFEAFRKDIANPETRESDLRATEARVLRNNPKPEDAPPTPAEKTAEATEEGRLAAIRARAKKAESAADIEIDNEVAQGKRDKTAEFFLEFVDEKHHANPQIKALVKALKSGDTKFDSAVDEAQQIVKGPTSGAKPKPVSVIKPDAAGKIVAANSDKPWGQIKLSSEEFIAAGLSKSVPLLSRRRASVARGFEMAKSEGIEAEDALRSMLTSLPEDMRTEDTAHALHNVLPVELLDALTPIIDEVFGLKPGG